MSARKVDSASRALQIYLEHSLASSASVLNSLSPAASESWNSSVLKAVQGWIDFLQKAQTSWSSYILAAIDRIEEHVLWIMKARDNRSRRDDQLQSTLSEISRREASYFVNTHMQRICGDRELAEMWEMAANMCQAICRSYTRGGLAGDGSTPPESEHKQSLNRYSTQTFTLKEAKEYDVRACDATDSAVQAAWKQAARNCRIVRVCRRINELHKAFRKSFLFSTFTTAGLSNTCDKAKCAVTCYEKCAGYRKNVAEEEEPCVKDLFLRASELICQLADSPPPFSGKWDSHPIIQNIDTGIVGIATKLSDHFRTLRGYEAKSQSAPLALRSARQEQLAAARRQLEDVVRAILASEVCAGLTETDLSENRDQPVAMLFTAATRTLSACSEELTADEKRVRYFTQQADAVDVSASPAHPHIQSCWAAAAEYMRGSILAGEEDAWEDDTSLNRANPPSSKLHARSTFMAMLAEGVFADAARLYAQEAAFAKRRPAVVPVIATYCHEAAESYLQAGIAAIKDANLHRSYNTIPVRAAQYEALARQCVRAMKLHELNPSPSHVELELHTLVLDILRSFQKQIQEDPEFPPYKLEVGHWSNDDIDSVCRLLNDASYVQGKLHEASREGEAAPALLPRARWLVATALTCGRFCLKQLSRALQDRREIGLLKEAVIYVTHVQHLVFQSPGPMEAAPFPVAATREATVHLQVSCDRLLQAARAWEQGSKAESYLWDKASDRWCSINDPRYFYQAPQETMNDRLLQCIGDHLAQRAKQLMKCKEDIEQMGEFAVYCAPAEDLGELLPHLAVIKEVARATAHRATHHYRAEMQKKRSVLGILHERVAAQFSNVLMYTQCDVESRLGLREHNDDYTLLAGLARQSARYFAYAAEAACAVTDKKLRDEIVALYTRAGDFLETNPFAKECSARKMETISCEDALHVAEQAGVRYASAARALAQGDRALHGAWMEAANATSCLVNERAVKTNKRRTRVLTAEYSPDAIERADVLAEKAEDMEKMHYICTDLCSSADEVDDRE